VTDLDPHYRLDEFAPAAWPAWQRKAEAMLGHTLAEATTSIDGVAVPPLRADDDRPTTATAVTTPGWQIVESLDDTADDQRAAAVREAGEGAAPSAWLTLPGSVRAGATDTHVDDALLLASRDAGVGLCIDGGAGASVAFDACARHEVTPVACLWDPLSALSELGVRRAPLADAYERIAALTNRVVARGSKTATVLASGVPIHEAGFGPVVELGVTLGAALAHLRGLEAQSVSLPQAAQHLWLRFALGPDLLVEVAKLRAARRLWSSVLRRLGADPRGMCIVAQTSRRRFSRLDEPVNLLRHTTAAFAGVVGGADRLEIRPHATVVDARARRWARNIHHLLGGEAWLSHVADPAAGSATVEHLTADLAAAAWPLAVRLSDDDPEAALRAALAEGFGHPPPQEPPQVGVDLFAPRDPVVEPEPAPPPVVTIAGAAATMEPLPRGRRAAAFEAQARAGGAR
jgi:methylmalonyl-CoA mutase